LGFFGPVPPLSPPLAADEEVTENARKRSIDNRNSTGRPESPAKRTKLSNGYENGLEAIPMDLDEPINGNGHAYPSPKEVEVEQPPPIVTTGPENGIQIEKVAELTSETSYLDLSSESPTSDSPILLHCQWSPRDPLRLATAGIDALTRLWTVPSRTPTLDAGRHVTVASRELVDEEGDKSPVSALAWTSDGEILAVGSNVDGIGRINIWSADGMRLQQFDALGYAPIVRLKWNPTNTLLLALSSLNKAAGGNSYLTVFSPPSTLSATFDLGPDFQPSDATWTGEMEFAICNSEGVFGYKCSDAMITPTKEYGTRREHGATSVIYDPTSHFMIAGSESGLIDVR
jgi:transducin (beta)-like 1